jgi:ketosteroid isomerase-like protein
VRQEGPPKPGDETTVYTAEDIRIQQYGDTAVVAFRLVATSEKAGAKKVTHYLNTGTFLKRDGKWRAVSWQATTVPAENEPKK